MRAVDLFCGTGGFSVGAHAAGIDVVSAYDNDPILTSSFSQNFPNTNLFIRDISDLTATSILHDCGGRKIDLVFGGPPCQGFSVMGKRQAGDPRRTLLQHFFRIVNEICPAVFVMENVQGLAYKDARPELIAAISLVSKKYEILDPIILDASEFGAATRRKRLFVIGYDKDRCDRIDIVDIMKSKKPATTVREAFTGLAEATKCSENDSAFDKWKIPANVQLSQYAQKLIAPARFFTGNLRTLHSDRILERFAGLPQGKIDKIGRHHRLDWEGQCPTIRAGTGPDKGSHQAVRPIHPEENRVITVREAARLQGFPDEHLFHPTIWHSFRMIGNSVSPILAREIFDIISKKN